MPQPGTLQVIADLAEGQWGLFTRQQAEDTGLAWSTLARMARSGVAERIAHGVYRLRGTPVDDQLGIRAAWLQLAPATPAWDRIPEQGVISHRSAAAAYAFGHLPADVHQFTLPVRRQTRREDVHLYKARLAEGEWTNLGGLLVTRPARIAADLLRKREDPEAVAQVVADALRGVREDPDMIARAIAPYASRFGLSEASGLELLEWLLDLTLDPQRGVWLDQARSAGRSGA